MNISNISVFGSKFRIGSKIPSPTSPISDTSHHFHDIGMKLISYRRDTMSCIIANDGFMEL